MADENGENFALLATRTSEAGGAGIGVGAGDGGGVVGDAIELEGRGEYSNWLLNELSAK